MSGGNMQQNRVILNNITELLAHALALENEAAERYAELADLMESHNNSDVAALFRRMATIEAQHGDHILNLRREYQLTDLPSLRFQWVSPEGPETTDPLELHYLMTPEHALQLALHNEKRAYAYYRDIGDHASDQETRLLAQQLAQEELDHVGWVKQWLEQLQPTPADWAHDDDPPLLQA